MFTSPKAIEIALSDTLPPKVLRSLLSDVLASPKANEIASTFGVAPSSRKAGRCARHFTSPASRRTSSWAFLKDGT